ncbi:MAG: hypothetical protein US51_C0005G0005 [Microgenomates group bacterium GW2011_GWA2_37_6]|nr:MAG: hypothetical protein US51_C0005G0005 [Microgenomates group bacterium GW2011_GWA2_37_6]
MPQAIVITRPFYDETTSYLHRWNLDVVKQAKAKSNSVADLKYKRANRKELESIVKKLKPEVIILNGHGSSDTILGQGDEVLIKAGKNEHILKNSNVFSLSCSSAKVLGPASIKAGAKSYIGYKEDFVFAYPKDYATRAEQDPLAKLFLEPTTKLATALVNGNPPEDCHEIGINAFLKNLQQVLLSNSTEEYVARFLVWDLTNQVYLHS